MKIRAKINLVGGFHVLNPRIIFLLIALLTETFLVNTNGQEQAQISGTVIEESTESPLPGANIFIKSLSLGTITDLNGEFTLLSVPPGEYTVEVSYVGYQTSTSIVKVQAGQEQFLEFKLKFRAQDLEEVSVTIIQARGQLMAINQQRSADQMKNVVSAERIQEVPDANAAESIARLPGIALKRSGGEGSNVVIRGLSPEYSKITINGVSIPSTDAESRTSDLSMISSESLSGIEVFKSLTPDMEGDAIAGTVNMQLAKARIKTDRYVRLYGIYNQDAKDLGYKGSMRWSQRVLNGNLGIQASLNAESRNRSSDGLSASYTLSAPIDGQPTPLRLTNTTVTDTEEIRSRYGANLIIDYSFGNWDFLLSNFYNRTERDIRNRQSSYKSENSENFSIISNPEQNLDLLTNILQANYTLKSLKIDWTLSHSMIRNNRLHENTLNFLQDAKPLPEEIDFETVHPSELLDMVVPDSSSAVHTSRHQENYLNERSYMADMNVMIPFNLGNSLAGELKFGGKYRGSQRDNYSVRSKYDAYIYASEPYPISDFFDSNYNPGYFLNGESSIGIILDPTKTNAFYHKTSSSHVENDWSIREYSTIDYTGAGYLMTKLRYKNLVTFIPGVRYEQFVGDYTGEYRITTGNGDGIKEPRTAHIVHKDWLPMFNLKIQPVDWFDIRMAITKTLVRPGYNEMLPNLGTDIQTNNASVSQGSPDLLPTRSWNYDTYLTFYNNFIGFFTIGGFYKQMDGVIIKVRQFIESQEKAEALGLPEVFYEYNDKATGNVIPLSYLDRELTRYENTELSFVKGIELDWQTNFSYLPSPFNGIVLNVNYTRLWSKTHYPYFNVGIEIDKSVIPYRIVKIYTNDLRQGNVKGQSDHLMNFSLGYDYKGFSARISLTYQGASLRSIYGQDELDNWNAAFTRLDFTLRQKAGEYLVFFLSGSNIGDQYDGTYHALDVRPTYMHYYGPNYDLGIQVKF